MIVLKRSFLLPVFLLALSPVIAQRTKTPGQKTPANTPVALKFKPPVVRTSWGNYWDSATVSVDQGKTLLGTPILITDDKKTSYSISSYRFLYKKRVVTEDDDGKAIPAISTVTDIFKSTPLPEAWIEIASEELKAGEELIFLDVIVKDTQGHYFFAPHTKDQNKVMITVKEGSIGSIPVIQQLAKVTWAVAYAPILSPPQMSYMLDLFYSYDSLQKQMDEGHRFILAMEEENPFGFASWSVKTNASSSIYRLHKIYIDPNQQGKGIGKVLLDFVLADIKAKGASDLELNVNRYNKARQFYEKIGFVITREEDIDIGNGYFMNDYVMNLSL